MKIKVQTNEKHRVQTIERDDKTLNWIEKHGQANPGKLPTLPNYFLPVVNYYIVGTPIRKDLQIIAPSGQYWQSLRSEQQAELLELVDWTGRDVEDYVSYFESMYPRDHRGKEW